MAEVVQMKAASGQGTKIIKFEDDTLLPYKKNLDLANVMKMTRELPYKDGDILVSSYTKCGRHWLVSMLWKMKTCDWSKREEDTILEIRNLADIDGMDVPRILTSHLRPNRLPREHFQNGGKIILLLRNPKDVAVSLYHHLKNSQIYANKQKFEEFFESFISGILPWGSYFDWLAEWECIIQDKMNGENTIQVEVFYYEDFKNDCIGTLEKLDRFLKFGRDRAYLEKVMSETGMDSVREEITRLTTNPFWLDNHGNTFIVRKGVIGDWKNWLTNSQSDEVDRVIKEKLHGDVFEFIYA